MSRTIAIVSCTKSKKDETCKAKEMYSESNYFNSMVRYSNIVLEADEIYILSAKYGLLFMGDYIDPYEQSLYDMSKAEIEQWSQQVTSELEVCLEPTDSVISVCGKKYMEYVKEFFQSYTRSYERRFEGVRMNSQIKEMNEAVAEKEQ